MITQENIKTCDQKTNKDWTAIDIGFEYPGFQGKEKWIIATDLSEKKLLSKYPEIKEKYAPYVIVPCEFLKARNEYKSNELFHYRFRVSHLDQYPVDDEKSEAFHKELHYEDEDIDYREIRAEKDKEVEKTIAALRKGIDLLTPIQKRRLIAVYFQGKTYRDIAQEENVEFSKIAKSVHQSLKKLKKFLETGGTKSIF